MKRSSIFYFVILMCCAVTVSVSQLKVSAVMPMVAEGFGISIGAAAALMSCFTAAGIILAIPGAELMKKLGPKRLLLLLMGCLCVGNLVGLVSKTHGVLIVGRLLEGVAFSMMIMVGIKLIHIWFADGGAGVATGVFNTNAAIGSFIAFNGALYVAQRFSVRMLWAIVAAVAVIDFFLILFFIPETKGEAVAGEAEKQGAWPQVLKDKRLIFLALSQMGITFVLFSYITCYPLLFTSFYGLSPERANLYASINGLFGIPACVLGGILVEKTKRPLTVAKVGAVGAAFTGLTMLVLAPGTIWLHLLAVALFPGGLVLTSIFCTAPTLAMKKEHVGYYVAFVNLLYYIGVFFSTPVTVKFSEASWSAAAGVIVVMGIVTFLCLCATSLAGGGTRVQSTY